jgi:hypothetical protein
MKKIKHIKLFEEFLNDEYKKILNNKETYLEYKAIPKTYFVTDDVKKISIMIRDYDIINFNVKHIIYGIIFYPDRNFKNMLYKLNDYIDNPISDIENMLFHFSIDFDNYNRGDFEKGIPIQLRGMGLGKKIYDYVIRYYSYITSNRFASKDAISLWTNLIQDYNYYAFTNNEICGVIYKKISDKTLLDIYNKLQDIPNIIFDNKLKEKICTL